MAKFDKNLLQYLNANNAYKDGENNAKMSQILSDEKVDALIRVRNPLHFSLLEKHFDVQKRYPFISSVAIKLGLKEAIELERMKEVEYVSASSTVFALDNTTYSNHLLNSRIIDKAQVADNNQVANEIKDGKIQFADKLIEGNINFADDVNSLGYQLDGSGVTLCVMDTGVTPHIDLSLSNNRITYFKDFINNEELPYDDNGHGTFVCGVALGNGILSSREIKGVAPKANLVSLKVIEKSGESSTLKILDGMQWLYDNFKTYNIKVVCMSFGADPLPYADPLKIGVEMLSRSGIICVVASGNSGIGTIKSPAISNEVIAVGAVDNDMRVASFTSRGVYQNYKRPDVYAKGVEVISIRAGDTYCKMSGTSSAAPYVAGACCLLSQKYPRITPYEAKNIILQSSLLVDGYRIFI